MWAALAAQGVMPPTATESDWQDLFAYFYSLQFAEPVGEAGRGKQVLENKRRTDCHSLSNAPNAFSIVSVAWGRAPTAHHRMLEKGAPSPTLSPAEVANLVAYLNSRSPAR